MRQAEPNCSLIKVDLSFPHLQVFMQGRPRHDKDSLKHPPMDLVHRARSLPRLTPWPDIQKR